MKGFWGISELIVNTRLPSPSTSRGEWSVGRTGWSSGWRGGFDLCLVQPLCLHSVEREKERDIQWHTNVFFVFFLLFLFLFYNSSPQSACSLSLCSPLVLCYTKISLMWEGVQRLRIQARRARRGKGQNKQTNKLGGKKGKANVTKGCKLLGDQRCSNKDWQFQGVNI